MEGSRGGWEGWAEFGWPGWEVKIIQTRRTTRAKPQKRSRDVGKTG